MDNSIVAVNKCQVAIKATDIMPYLPEISLQKDSTNEKDMGEYKKL